MPVPVAIRWPLCAKCVTTPGGSGWIAPLYSLYSATTTATGARIHPTQPNPTLRSSPLPVAVGMPCHGVLPLVQLPAKGGGTCTSVLL